MTSSQSPQNDIHRSQPLVSLLRLRQWLEAGLRHLTMLSCFALALAAGACSTQYDGLAVQSMGTPPAYKLDTGDRIAIGVFGEENLSGEYEVDPAGVVSLPLAGRVEVAHLTTQEAERTIEKRLGSGIVSKPNVTVSVVRYRPFYVIGEVAKPGGYAFYPGATVLSAVAVAGGYTYRAEKMDIRLLRQGGEAGAKPQRMTPGTFIQPGDIVIVPERWF